MSSFQPYYTTAEIQELRKADNKIYGKVAANLNPHNPDLNNAKGYYGEQIVGNIINLMAVETEGFYVCHAVADYTGGQHRTETDHIILFRNKLIIVEAKAYLSYQHYRINKDGILSAKRDLKHKNFRKINDSHIYQKANHYQIKYPHLQVHAVIAITRDNIKTESLNGKYKVASLDNILLTLRALINEARPIKQNSWGIVKHFATHCIKQETENPKAPINPTIPAPKSVIRKNRITETPPRKKKNQPIKKAPTQRIPTKNGHKK